MQSPFVRRIGRTARAAPAERPDRYQRFRQVQPHRDDWPTCQHEYAERNVRLHRPSGGIVDSGQKLSHYRGQIEPPASLPRGAMVGCFGEVLSEEWRKRQEPESAIAARLRLTLPLTSWAACRPRLAPPGELGT